MWVPESTITVKILKSSKVKSLSRVRLLATPWTVAYQAPLSMGFSRQECWNGLPFPSPGDLPDPGIEPGSRALQTDPLPSEPPGKPPGKSLVDVFDGIPFHSPGARLWQSSSSHVSLSSFSGSAGSFCFAINPVEITSILIKRSLKFTSSHHLSCLTS